MRILLFSLVFVCTLPAAAQPATEVTPATATHEHTAIYNDVGERLRVVDQVLTATDQARLRHNQLLAQGLLEKEANNFVEAIKTLEAALAAYPGSSVVLVQLAELCYRDDTARAQKYLDRAKDVDPDYYYVYLIQALVHQKSGELDLMLESLNRCLELKPNQADAIRLRADYFQQKVNSPESLRLAIEDYLKLQQALPQQMLYWNYYIGRCYFYLKEYAKAQSYLETIMGTPMASQAAYLLGKCKQALGEYAEAMNYLSRIQNNPLASEDLAQISLILAESATGEIRVKYLSRALEEINQLLKNPTYKATPDKFLTAGKLAIQLGLPHAAVDYLELYLEKVPDDLDAKGLLVRALIANAAPDKKDLVEATFRSYASVAPATAVVDLRRLYVRYLLKMEDWEQANSELETLKATAPSSTDGEIALLDARAAFGTKDYASAIASATEAARLMPGARDEIEILIGVAYLNAASHELARVHFDQAIDAATESLKGIRCLEIGNMFQEKNLNEDRIRYWNRALDLHPKNHQLRYEIGLSYLRSGSPELSVPYFERITREGTEPALTSQAETLLGYVAILSGATEEAERRYRSAIDKWSANLPALRGLAHLLSDLDRMEESKDYFKQAVAQEPEDATLAIQLGIVCDKIDDVTGAEEAARAAMRADPDYAEAYNFLGYMYAERGIKLEEAQKLVEKAMELEPKNPNITDSLGWVYFQRGDYEKSVATLEEAASLVTEDYVSGSSVIYEHLGDAYEKTGKLEKAREMWEKAAQGDPKSESALKKLNQSAQESKAGSTKAVPPSKPR